MGIVTTLYMMIIIVHTLKKVGGAACIQQPAYLRGGSGLKGQG